MIHYEKKFRLDSGVSFSRYIKTLNESSFSPYTLLIEKDDTNSYHIEIVIANPFHLWGWYSAFIGGVLLNKCTVTLSEDKQFFALQASTGTGNPLFALFLVILSVLFFFVMLFLMIAKTAVDNRNIFIVIIITFICLAPVIFTYIREKKLLERIGSLGSEPDKK